MNDSSENRSTEPWELLVEEFLERRRRGERPSLEEFMVRCPGNRVELEQAITALLLLEEAAPEDPVLPVPEQIGDYRIVREIGRGGMGVVFEAEQITLRRRAAIKVMARAAPNLSKRLERFRREAEVASRLDHPGICTIYEAGSDGGYPFIAMQFIEGRSLAAVISGRRDTGDLSTLGADVHGAPTAELAETLPNRVRIRELVEIIEQASRALHVAHEAGIVHRDIKPGNIMITPDDDPVILDFGLARDLAEGAPTLTESGELFGTLPYMSPEQLRHDVARLDRRTDVYSLGVTLFEALTLRRPFESPTRESMHRSILDIEAPPARELNPQVARDLEVILETALAKRREHRYLTAWGLAEDLRRWRDGEPIKARTISTFGRVLRWSRRRPARAALAAVLLVAVPLIAFLIGSIRAQRPSVIAHEERQREIRLEQALVDGYAALREGSAIRASIAFRDARRIAPGSAEALGGFVLATLRSSDPEKALRLLDESTDEDETFALRRLRVRALRKLGRQKDAQRVEDSLPEPKTALAHFMIGTEHMIRARDLQRRDAWADAREAIARAILYSPSPRRFFYFELAHSIGELGDAAAAYDVAGAMQKLWPEDPSSWHMQGIVLQYVDPERAEEAFDRALELDPEHAWARAGRAFVRWRRGNREGAFEDLHTAVEMSPDDSALRNSYGYRLQEAGRLEESETELRRAYAGDRDSPLIINNLAATLALRGEMDEARKLLREAARIEPRLGITYYNLAILDLREGRPADTIRLLEKARELGMVKPDLHVAFARTYVTTGRLESAVRHWREAARLAPRDPVILSDLGGALCDGLGDYEGAAAALEKAVEIDPETAVHHHRLGNVYFYLDRHRESAESYGKAVRLDRAMEQAWYGYGLALQAVGRYQEAIHAYRQAIIRGYPPAEPLRGLAESIGGPRTKAWAPSRKVLADASKRLDRVLAGEPMPEGGAELAWLSLVAHLRGRHDDSVRLAVAAFAREGELARRLSPPWAYFAAASAVLACIDSPAESRKATANRRRALGWMKDQLEGVTRATDDEGRGRQLRAWLESWMAEPDFASVRDGELLELLPSGAREGWAAFWESVDDYLDQL